MSFEVLVMCLANPSGNPRPNRIVKLLASQGFAVDVLSYPPSGKLNIRRHLPLPSPPRKIIGRIARRLRYIALRSLQSLWRRDKVCDWLNDWELNVLFYRDKLINHDYALIVVENLQLLPLALRIRGKASILFDAREYYPLQAENSRLFRWIERPESIRLCRKYLSQCDQVITVSPGLAAEYKREFGVSCEVIMSVPSYRALTPRKTNPDRIRMVHHGVANRNRKIETMIDIAKKLDARFTLDLYLTSNPGYIRKMKHYAKDAPNVRICDPVPFDAIIPMLSNYDIGLYYLEPTGFNVTYNLPNKLFEFIQARLMVAIGPSPDMATVVRQHDCGIVANAFSIESMAACLNGLDSEKIDLIKQNSHAASRKLSYEKESEKLLAIVSARKSTHDTSRGVRRS